MLLYYVNRPQVFCRDKRLFVCYWGPRQGKSTTSQSLSRWRMSAIHTAYRLAGIQGLLVVKPYSMRAAFHRQSPFLDICRLVTWFSEGHIHQVLHQKSKCWLPCIYCFSERLTSAPQVRSLGIIPLWSNIRRYTVKTWLHLLVTVGH